MADRPGKGHSEPQYKNEKVEVPYLSDIERTLQNNFGDLTFIILIMVVSRNLNSTNTTDNPTVC